LNPAPEPPPTPRGRTPQGERTRAALLSAALDLFLERGYEGTTMRDVAGQAGVSLGNTYYYFDSKETLIQGFYERTHLEHQAACEELLAEEKDLRRRLRGVLLAKIETAEPYHRFSGLLFQRAADPKSPLNPFSAESEPVRAEATELMERVLEGSKAKVPADLQDELPRLLWLYEMAVILFWIHDDSTDRKRTRRLIESTSELIGRLVSLAGLPLMGPLRKLTLKLLRDIDAGGIDSEAVR